MRLTQPTFGNVVVTLKNKNLGKDDQTWRDFMNLAMQARYSQGPFEGKTIGIFTPKQGQSHFEVETLNQTADQAIQKALNQLPSFQSKEISCEITPRRVPTAE